MNYRIERIRIPSFRKTSGFIILCILIFIMAGSGAGATSLAPTEQLRIPAQEEWKDYGPIFKAGAEGQWDYYLWGGFAGSAIKKNGKYYLYYQGASGYRTAYDETVTWRAIGVAVSSDGINFSKYSGNPVITWFPNKNEEEGAVSAAVALDQNDEFVMYYGANSEQTATLVNADARLAVSADGISFKDMGVVLSHKNRDIWGFGDELSPIIAFNHDGQWFVYYIPNGTPQRGKLGVAWGDGRDRLANSSRVRDRFFLSVRVWGMGGYAKVAPDKYVLFINDVMRGAIEVRTVSPKAPDKISRPLETYRFDKVKHATVLLDRERNTWFMYYRGEDYYGVKLAPAGGSGAAPSKSRD